MERSNLEMRRRLRKDQTDAERKLWSALRNRQMIGVKFRRQFSIDKYIIDFYCPEYKLAVEADGGQHYEESGMKKDEIRAKVLGRYGIKVLRFSDIDILCNIDGVCEAILGEIERKDPSPLPLSPRAGEREG